ncbi:winged helix-turn-helix domain-containing protein [Sphingomicrobium clamense]|uniref:winged helix-turn-helix domain-containing protein n=1 Tax=Sphingomicrobium clamense TaxID=2851013 RepID=UPI002103301F|nr:winged helix-turn-helix domain-containing protein [Sphingomicrobium sp. B8]
MTLGGREQRLEPRIAGLLDHLLDRPGETLGREELLDEVWGDEGSDEALTQAVSRLRQYLGDRSLIRTEPRKGYRLMVEAVPVLEAGRTPPAAARPSPRYSARVVQLAFVAGFVMALVIAALGWAFFGPKPVTVFEEITQPIEPNAPPERRTVRCEGDPEQCEQEFRPVADN